MKQAERIRGTVGRALVLLAALLGLMPAAGRAQELRAGYAKVDVTPSEPVFLGGYNLRNAPSDGVHEGDRLYARALVFDSRACAWPLSKRT